MNMMSLVFIPACLYLSLQDIRKKKVDLWILLILIIVAAIGMLFAERANCEQVLLGGTVGIFLLAISKLTNQIGLGDGLLVISTGIILGPYLCLYMILLAFVVALCFFGFLRLFRKMECKTIPFIPFISVSFFIVLFFYK